MPRIYNTIETESVALLHKNPGAVFEYDTTTHLELVSVKNMHNGSDVTGHVTPFAGTVKMIGVLRHDCSVRLYCTGANLG